MNKAGNRGETKVVLRNSRG